MEKEIDKKNLVLKEDESIGTVQIADDVVAMIASLAATEVDGVSAMAGNVTNELMSKVGVKSLTKGVKVEVLDKNVTVDLTVTMEYGYNIPATCQAVQQKVKNAIENMTGLTCSDVNIRIAGVNMRGITGRYYGKTRAERTGFQTFIPRRVSCTGGYAGTDRIVPRE